MRVAFVTDLHITEDPKTRSLYSDHMAVLEILVREIALAQPDLILIGGDLSDHKVPHRATPAERNAHVDLRVELSKIAPIVEVMGNHDIMGDYAFFNRLKTKNPFRYHEAMDADDFPDFVVWSLPWVYQGSATGHEEHQALVDETVELLMDNARDLKRDELDQGIRRPHFLLAHCAVAGASVSEGQPDVPTKDPVVRREDLFVEVEGVPIFDAMFFGHYHVPQRVGPRGAYGGGLLISSYGEGLDRGWTLYDTITEKFTHQPIVQPVRLTIGVDFRTGMITKVKPDVGIPLDKVTSLEEVDFTGADVKLVVYTDRGGIGSDLGALERAKAAVRKTARSLKEEFVRDKVASETREGADEVAEATSDEEKIMAYLTKGVPVSERPDKATLDSVKRIYEEISAEVTA